MLNNTLNVKSLISLSQTLFLVGRLTSHDFILCWDVPLDDFEQQFRWEWPWSFVTLEVTRLTLLYLDVPLLEVLGQRWWDQWGEITPILKKNTLILTTDPKFQRDILVIPTNCLINETQNIAWCFLATFCWGGDLLLQFQELFLKTGGNRFQLANPFQDPPTRKTSLMQRSRRRNRLPECVLLCFWFGSGEKKNEKTAKVTGVFRSNLYFRGVFPNSQGLGRWSPSCELKMQNKCQKIHTPFTWQFCWWPFWDGDLWPFQWLSITW